MFSEKIVQHMRGSVDNWGTFAAQIVSPGETLWRVDPNAPRIAIVDFLRDASITNGEPYSQLDEHWLIRNTQEEHRINHSCEPNCYCTGFELIALRRIDIGEEITFDYAMTDVSLPFAFLCNCGSARCRRIWTNTDYLEQDFQAAYAAHLTPFLQQRIAHSSRVDRIRHHLRKRARWIRLTIFGGIVFRPFPHRRV